MSKAKFEQTKTLRLQQTLTSKLNNSNNNNNHNNHNNNNEETVDSFSLIPISTPISTPIEAPTETQAVDSTEVDSTGVSKGLADSLTQAQNQIGLCLQKQRQVSFILREVKDILKR